MPKNRVNAVFKVLDDGEYQGWTVYETFFMDSASGVRVFKNFTEVIGVDVHGSRLDASACKGKVLRVKVRHRKDAQGKTWPNVAAHAEDVPF